MRRLGKLLLTALLLALVAGCSSAPSRRPDEPATAPAPAAGDPAMVSNLPTTATPLWVARLQALQPPIPAGDVLIAVVAARGDELDVVALDRRTGEVRWRRPLMVVDSDVGSYLGDLVHRSGDGTTYVVFQQAATGSALRPGEARPYLAVDPSSGEVVARTPPAVARFGAPSCDDGLDVCLRISDELFDETRWVLGSWRLRPERDRLPDGANSLWEGSEVYTVSGTVDGYRSATALGRAGKDGWRLPAQRLTGSSGRWHLDDGPGLVDEDRGVAVVQLVRRVTDAQSASYLAGREVRLDVSERRTVGVDIRRGAVLWRHDGADFTCLELSRYELPVRCAFTGHVAHRAAWAEPRLVRPHGFVEGYDPATGETTWRHRLSARAVGILLLRADELDIEVDELADADGLAVVPTAGAPRLVSFHDGSSRDLVGDESLLCTRTVPYRHRFDDTTTSVVVGFGDVRVRSVRETCDAQGGPGRAPVGATGLLTGAVDAGDGAWVFAGPERIEAHELS